MHYLLYIVEDDENLNQVLTSYLKNQGWDVISFTKGRDAQTYIDKPPHLWILDIMLDDLTGYDLIKEIKSFNPRTPVIFISARYAELDRVIGLEMGSDDYIAKPFLPKELVIRASKLLQRMYESSGDPVKTLAIGPYKIDTHCRVVHDASATIYLTSKEFDLLLFLATHPGMAFTREQILDRMWGEDYCGTDRVVDDLIRRIRRRLDKINVETIYGYGYRVLEK